MQKLFLFTTLCLSVSSTFAAEIIDEISKDLDGDGVKDKVLRTQTTLSYQLSSQQFKQKIIKKDDEGLGDSFFIVETKLGFKFGSSFDGVNYSTEDSTFVIYDEEARKMRVSGCLSQGRRSNSFLNIIVGKYSLNDQESELYTVDKKGETTPSEPVFLDNYQYQCEEKLEALLKKYRTKN